MRLLHGLASHDKFWGGLGCYSRIVCSITVFWSMQCQKMEWAGKGDGSEEIGGRFSYY